jgi:hypothetical protein
MLLWFIFDYKTWVSDSNNWYQSSITDGDRGYGIAHHGNIWCSIWQQAIARISGYFYNDTENQWYHHSVLCGGALDSVISTKNVTNPTPVTQLVATTPNAYNAMRFYDRYYGDQVNSSTGVKNGYGKILGVVRHERYNPNNISRSDGTTMTKFSKTGGAMWSDSFYTTSATSNSYPCKESGDLQNFIVWAVGKNATTNLYYFFDTWGNKYKDWTQTDTATTTGVSTTYSPTQAIRSTVLSLYNSYAAGTFTIPRVNTPACGQVDTTQPISNTPTATAVSSSSTSTSP